METANAVAKEELREEILENEAEMERLQADMQKMQVKIRAQKEKKEKRRKKQVKSTSLPETEEPTNRHVNAKVQAKDDDISNRLEHEITDERRLEQTTEAKAGGEKQELDI